MLGTFFKRKPKIIFMYANRYQYSGSTIMRGKQLCSIINYFYGDRYTSHYRPLSTHFTNCIIFLTKGAVTDITLEQLADLSRKGNYILLDPVDNPLDQDKASYATCVVAASREAHEAYSRMGLRTFLVNHHVDTRLPHPMASQKNTLRCGYFGELVNTVMTRRIAERVDFIHVDTGKQTTDWLDKPAQYNLHYAVRSNNVTAFKPFLKGFTAAACHANIIIQKNQTEAVLWLGKDYPYLLDSNPTEQDILNMLDFAQESYGKKEWVTALGRMNDIRKATNSRVIANEFDSMVRRIL